MDELLSWLRTELSEVGVSQTDLSTPLGISQAQVSRLLSGNSSLSLSGYLTVCRFAGLDAAAGIRVAQGAAQESEAATVEARATAMEARARSLLTHAERLRATVGG